MKPSGCSLIPSGIFKISLYNLSADLPRTKILTSRVKRGAVHQSCDARKGIRFFSAMKSFQNCF